MFNQRLIINAKTALAVRNLLQSKSMMIGLICPHLVGQREKLSIWHLPLRALKFLPLPRLEPFQG